MNPMPIIPHTSRETTDLERRILAHERILHSLIACLSRTEPRFVEHLREKFVEPMTMVHREHDHRDADDFAQEFIRAVIFLGEGDAAVSEEGRWGARPHNLSDDEPASVHPFHLAARPDRVEVREMNGIWEVKVDGVFRGDYHRKESALAAAALAKLVDR